MKKLFFSKIKVNEKTLFLKNKSTLLQVYLFQILNVNYPFYASTIWLRYLNVTGTGIDFTLVVSICLPTILEM